MSKSIVNSVVAKQLMTTLKDITGQLKTVADARESISHTPGYTVRIDEEKITPELLQRMNQVLIEFYVELSSGIIAEPKPQTYEAVQLPFPSSPSFQRRFFENLNRDEFGRFQPQQPFADSRQQVTDPSSFNEEDRRLLMYVQEFVRNMHQQNQTFIDLYCQLLEKEPAYFVQGKCYKLLYRDVTGANIQQHRTYEIATDIRFFNQFNALPITRLSIECVE